MTNNWWYEATIPGMRAADDTRAVPHSRNAWTEDTWSPPAGRMHCRMGSETMSPGARPISMDQALELVGRPWLENIHAKRKRADNLPPIEENEQGIGEILEHLIRGARNASYMRRGWTILKGRDEDLKDGTLQIQVAPTSPHHPHSHPRSALVTIQNTTTGMRVQLSGLENTEPSVYYTTTGREHAAGFSNVRLTNTAAAVAHCCDYRNGLRPAPVALETLEAWAHALFTDTGQMRIGRLRVATDNHQIENSVGKALSEHSEVLQFLATMVHPVQIHESEKWLLDTVAGNTKRYVLAGNSNRMECRPAPGAEEDDPLGPQDSPDREARENRLIRLIQMLRMLSSRRDAPTLPTGCEAAQVKISTY